MRNTDKKLEQTVLNIKIQRRYPKDEVRGRSTTEVTRKRKAAVEEKEERVWVIRT